MPRPIFARPFWAAGGGHPGNRWLLEAPFGLFWGRRQSLEALNSLVPCSKFTFFGRVLFPVTAGALRSDDNDYYDCYDLHDDLDYHGPYDDYDCYCLTIWLHAILSSSLNSEIMFSLGTFKRALVNIRSAQKERLLGPGLAHVNPILGSAAVARGA